MLKVMIVEDEENALEMMEMLLNSIGGIEVLGKYQNPAQVPGEVQNNPPDAIFMDIGMPGMNGLELAAKVLDLYEGIKIIFVTAYPQYAIDAFELESVDYILKPVTMARLEKAVERLKKWLEYEPAPPGILGATLYIKCFQRFEAIFPGQAEPIKWKTAKVKELFAFLIHHLDQNLTRDEIIETLFPDEDFDKAKINFHTCMSYLRKSLNEGGLGTAIYFADNCYRLSGKNIAVDVMRFREIIRSGKIIDDENPGLFQEAAALYQGDYLEKDGYQWAEHHREALRIDYVELLKTMARYYEQRGDIRSAEKHYSQILEICPYSEDYFLRLLQLKQQTGKRSEAIQLYQSFAERLRNDIGIDPGPKIKEICEAMMK